MPSIDGDIHTISSPGTYSRYRLDFLVNNGSTEFIQVGEVQFWGDIPLTGGTFSDSWTSGDTSINNGTTYTIPTYTTADGTVLTASGTLDTNTDGTYNLYWSYLDGDVTKRISRNFVVSTAYVYSFIVTHAPAHTDPRIEWTELSTSTSGFTITESMISLSTSHTWSYSAGTTVGEIILDGVNSESGGTLSTSNITAGDTLFTLTTSTELTDITIYTHRPKYFPGFRIDLNGTPLVTDSGNGGSADTPSPFSRTYYLTS